MRDASAGPPLPPAERLPSGARARPRVRVSCSRRARRPCGVALLACGTEPPVRGSVGTGFAGGSSRGRSCGTRLSAKDRLAQSVPHGDRRGVGASQALVGIDDASARALPSLADVPRVGGLFNPSLEGVVALEPDWVVLVPSVEQRDFSARLEELGVAVEAFPNDSLQAVVSTIESMGERLGPAAERRAGERARAIETTRRVVAGVAEHYDSAAQRDRAPARSSLRRRSKQLPRRDARGRRRRERGACLRRIVSAVAAEWLVEAAPQLILDSSFDAELGVEFWQRWPSVPAVANQRVVSLRDPLITLPGPRSTRRCCDCCAPFTAKRLNVPRVKAFGRPRTVALLFRTAISERRLLRELALRRDREPGSRESRGTRAPARARRREDGAPRCSGLRQPRSSRCRCCWRWRPPSGSRWARARSRSARRGAPSSIPRPRVPRATSSGAFACRASRWPHWWGRPWPQRRSSSRRCSATRSPILSSSASREARHWPPCSC